jgi:hypothetical protein
MIKRKEVPMLKLKLDLSGKNSVFLSNSHRYYNGLATLDLYRNPPDKVPSLVQLKEGLDRFNLAYEGAVNGDRIQISTRKKARKDLTEMFEKILHFLQSMSAEDDIQSLLQAGFEVVSRAHRTKVAVAPAT